MDEQTKLSTERVEDFFRHELAVECDIGVYIDLVQAITDFLLWMESNGYAQQTITQYKRVLNRFLSFIKASRFGWDEIFTAKTVEAFEKSTVASNGPVILNLARYLYLHKSIRHPIESKHQPLPGVFQQYLDYRQKTGQTSWRKIKQIRRVLSAFNDHVEPLSQALEKSHPGVVVMNPGKAAIRFAELVMDLGISHSKRSYPKPAKDVTFPF